MVAGACKERTQEKGVMQAHDGPMDLSKLRRKRNKIRFKTNSRKSGGKVKLKKKLKKKSNLRETLRIGAAISTHPVDQRVQAQG